MKLRTKIIIAFAISISVSFLMLLYITQNKMTDLNVNQTENFNQQIVQSKANEVGSWLYQRVCELRTMSQYDALILNEGDEINEEALKPYLERLNNRVKDLFGNSSRGTFFIVNKNGIGWTDDHIRLDVSEREYFLEAMALDESVEYTISKPLISKIDGKRRVFICYPVRNSEGEKVCYIIGGVAVTKLDDIVSGIRIFDGTVWIMDRYGRVISQDNNHGEEYVFNPRNLSLTKTAAQLQQTNYGVRPFEADGVKGQLIYSSIPYTDGWRLCVLAENDIVYGETRNVQRNIVLIWICLLLLALILSTGFSHQIVKPLRRLQSAMKEVEEENFDVAFDTKNSRDEVSQLGQSFNSMVKRIKALLAKVVQEQNEKRQAEFRTLQAQINPHFLYNTLDTIQWKALEHNAVEVADIINALSGFFRVSLSDGKEIITLNEEVEHAYNYLFIQKTRYRDKLDFDIRLQDGLENRPVIKMLLQPIIENAIYHGIKPSEKKGLVEVDITAENGFVIMRVADNGVGMEPMVLEKLRNGLEKNEEKAGFGLFNVNERIRLAYGDEYGVCINSKAGEGTAVTIKIPLQKEVLEC